MLHTTVLGSGRRDGQSSGYPRIQRRGQKVGDSGRAREPKESRGCSGARSQVDSKGRVLAPFLTAPKFSAPPLLSPPSVLIGMALGRWSSTESLGEPEAADGCAG